MNPIVGVKAYGWEWATAHGLTMAEAGRRLARQGVDWALVQNLTDPLPGSAVDQIPPAGAFDDAAWVGAVRDAGVRAYQSTAVTFAPHEFAAHPDLRPVDQWGRVFERFTWYVGICPTSPDYARRKAERFAEAVGRTRPDGIFLSFLRFPAFWELWLPEVERADIAEYCFCDRCTGLFEAATGEVLPAGGVTARAAVLTHELRPAWTAWKCAVVADLALRLRQAAEAACPGVDVILNAFGLGGPDFGNAVEEVLGQRFADLDQAVDTYELMFYWQIQKREPDPWIPQRVAEARSQTGRRLLACLQGGAEYLEEAYRAGGRRREITATDWRGALAAVARSSADGVMVYSWRDLLADEAAGGDRVRDLLAYKAGDLTPA